MNYICMSSAFEFNDRKIDIHVHVYKTIKQFLQSKRSLFKVSYNTPVIEKTKIYKII